MDREPGAPAVADAAGGAVPCPACSRSNPAGFRFCGYCGVAMERTCPACGQTSPADFTFCGSCGSSLDEPFSPAPAELSPVPPPVAELAAPAEPTEHHLGPVEEPPDLEELEDIDLPLDASEVATDDTPPAPARVGKSPLVGRDAELEALRSELDRTREGSPRLVTVVGPAGIGKSRLVEEFARGLSAENGSTTVARGRCLPYEEGPTYWPLAEILKADAGILNSDRHDTILRRALAGLTGRFPTSDEASGVIRVLLSSIGVDVHPDPLTGTPRGVATEVIVRSWQRYLESLAGPGPLLVVLEDLQWADAGLLDLVEYLAARLTAPVMLLGTARPELSERRASWGEGAPSATTVTLAPLGDDESRELVRYLLGSAEVPADVMTTVIDRTQGSPLFVEELLRLLVERDVLVRQGEAWSSDDGIQGTLPDTAEGVIEARLDRLPADQQRAIEDASVVGPAFWPDAVERLGTPDAEEALRALADHELVAEREPSRFEGQPEFEFRHDLTREVASRDLPLNRRAEAHGAALEWAEEVTHGRAGEFAEVLARHAERAGDPVKSGRFALLAGDRKARVFRTREALEWYERAMAAADPLPEGEAGGIAAEIALARGRAHEQLGKLPEAESDYRVAIAAAGQTDDAQVEVRARVALAHVLRLQARPREGLAAVSEALDRVDEDEVDADELLPSLRYTAGTLSSDATDWRSAVTHFEDGLRSAESHGDLLGEAFNRHGLADTLRFTGPFDEALTHALRARDLFGTVGHRPMFDHNEPTVGWLEWSLGRYPDAEQVLDRTVADTEESGDRSSEIPARSARSLVRLATGRIGPALEDLDRAVELSQAVGAPQLEYPARLFRLDALAEMDLVDLVEADLPQTDAVAEAMGTPPLRPLHLALQGWVAHRRDRTKEGARLFREARDLANPTLTYSLWSTRVELLALEEGHEPDELAHAADRLSELAVRVSPTFLAWALYGRAVAALRGGNEEAAQELARSAVAQAERLGKRRVEWRALSVLAEVLEEGDNAEEARATRRRAGHLVGAIAKGIPDEDMRTSFTSRPLVVSTMKDPASS
jgi:tetratricopeptide (TPR) repeat protein